MFRKTNSNSTPRRARLGRPTPAMAVACTALFMALGGVGYAAATIGSAQIKNNSVQGKDIKNSTIKSKDISKGTRNALKGQSGPAGANGANGANGAPGAPGLQGPIGQRGPSNLRIAANNVDINVPTCAGGENQLPDCTALLSRTLFSGSYLITAKFLLDNNDGAKSSTSNFCGLVTNLGGLIDVVRVPSLGITGQAGEAEVVTLTGVRTSPLNLGVSVRCNSQAGESFVVEDAKITALEVESVVGP